MIPQQGHMELKMYNPRKIKKYDVLERLVCEGVYSPVYV
jgi:hypothetical protein